MSTPVPRLEVPEVTDGPGADAGVEGNAVTQAGNSDGVLEGNDFELDSSPPPREDHTAGDAAPSPATSAPGGSDATFIEHETPNVDEASAESPTREIPASSDAFGSPAVEQPLVGVPRETEAAGTAATESADVIEPVTGAAAAPPPAAAPKRLHLFPDNLYVAEIPSLAPREDAQRAPGPENSEGGALADSDSGHHVEVDPSPMQHLQRQSESMVSVASANLSHLKIRQLSRRTSIESNGGFYQRYSNSGDFHTSAGNNSVADVEAAVAAARERWELESAEDAARAAEAGEAAGYERARDEFEGMLDKALAKQQARAAEHKEDVRRLESTAAGERKHRVRAEARIKELSAELADFSKKLDHALSKKSSESELVIKLDAERKRVARLRRELDRATRSSDEVLAERLKAAENVAQEKGRLLADALKEIKALNLVQARQERALVNAAPALGEARGRGAGNRGRAAAEEVTKLREANRRLQKERQDAQRQAFSQGQALAKAEEKLAKKQSVPADGGVKALKDKIKDQAERIAVLEKSAKGAGAHAAASGASAAKLRDGERRLRCKLKDLREKLDAKSAELEAARQQLAEQEKTAKLAAVAAKVAASKVKVVYRDKPKPLPGGHRLAVPAKDPPSPQTKRPLVPRLSRGAKGGGHRRGVESSPDSHRSAISPLGRVARVPGSNPSKRSGSRASKQGSGFDAKRPHPPAEPRGVQLRISPSGRIRGHRGADSDAPSNASSSVSPFSIPSPLLAAPAHFAAVAGDSSPEDLMAVALAEANAALDDSFEEEADEAYLVVEDGAARREDVPAPVVHTSSATPAPENLSEGKEASIALEAELSASAAIVEPTMPREAESAAAALDEASDQGYSDDPFDDEDDEVPATAASSGASDGPNAAGSGESGDAVDAASIAAAPAAAADAAAAASEPVAAANEAATPSLLDSNEGADSKNDGPLYDSSVPDAAPSWLQKKKQPGAPSVTAAAAAVPLSQSKPAGEGPAWLQKAMRVGASAVGDAGAEEAGTGAASGSGSPLAPSETQGPSDAPAEGACGAYSDDDFEADEPLTAAAAPLAVC